MFLVCMYTVFTELKDGKMIIWHILLSRDVPVLLGLYTRHRCSVSAIILSLGKVQTKPTVATWTSVSFRSIFVETIIGKLCWSFIGKHHVTNTNKVLCRCWYSQHIHSSNTIRKTHTTLWTWYPHDKCESLHHIFINIEYA